MSQIRGRTGDGCLTSIKATDPTGLDDSSPIESPYNPRRENSGWRLVIDMEWPGTHGDLVQVDKTALLRELAMRN